MQLARPLAASAAGTPQQLTRPPPPLAPQQNLNGPCPLLAIANVLSLRNELKLPARLSGVREVSQSDLIQLVADRLLEAGRAYENAPEYASYLQQNLQDSFEVLSKLCTGVVGGGRVPAGCWPCCGGGRRPAGRRLHRSLPRAPRWLPSAAASPRRGGQARRR